jgi:predicted phosphoribosyltransferase
MRFRDRADAGRRLADRLGELAAAGALPDPLLLALPRGGVPVAAEAARTLKAPLDVLPVRKIGVPGRPEAGIGALVGEDPPLFDRESMAFLGLTEDRLAGTYARERRELRRRETAYREGRPPPEVEGRTVILIDDGLATGVTARAACAHLRRRDPGRHVLAVPVAAPDAADRLAAETDLLVCLHQPPDFYAVGQWYQVFDQTTDEEVIATLHEFAAP